MTPMNFWISNVHAVVVTITAWITLWSHNQFLLGLFEGNHDPSSVINPAFTLSLSMLYFIVMLYIEWVSAHTVPTYLPTFL